MNKIQKLVVFVIFLAAAGSAGWYLVSEMPIPVVEVPSPFSNTLLRSPKPIEPFQLLTQDRNIFNREQFLGKWNWIFVGYTHCPDICPTTLTTLKSVAKRLTEEEVDEHSQYIFVTVDPGRDSAEHLKQYLGYFGGQFIGLTGEMKAIDKLVRQIDIIYDVDGNSEGEDYIVNHSASIALIDPEGRYYAKLNPPFTTEKLVEAFKRITQFYKS